MCCQYWQQISPVSTSDGNSHLPIMTTALLCPNPNLRKKKEKKNQTNKWLDKRTQTQAHGWLDGRTNAWNDNNTHRHQCWPRVSHLETSAFLTLCHSFPVTCQQMCKNLKMWLTDLLTDKRTDRRTDKRVAGGHYCWGVLLWPPQLGLGGKCDKKWKFIFWRCDLDLWPTTLKS